VQTVQGSAFVQSYRAAEAEHKRKGGFHSFSWQTSLLPFDPRRARSLSLHWLGRWRARSRQCSGLGYWPRRHSRTGLVDSASSEWHFLRPVADSQCLHSAEAPRRRMRSGSFAIRCSRSPGQTANGVVYLVCEKWSIVFSILGSLLEHGNLFYVPVFFSGENKLISKISDTL